MKPSNFSAILWDFDGVILNSNEVRTLGFQKVLNDFPEEQVQRLLKFHEQNGGLSRYVKFRYFYEEILKTSITRSQVNELAGRFSEIMLQLLTDKSLLIQSTLKFINKMHTTNKEMHIVSGADGKELTLTYVKN